MTNVHHLKLAHRTLYICRGLPASGKTTWARAQIEKHGFWVKRVNMDDLRTMLDNGGYSPEREYAVQRCRDMCISTMLSMGYTVICDDTNVSPHIAQTLLTIAAIAGVRVQCIQFDTSLHLCIERDAMRVKPVGKQVITDMFANWQSILFTAADPLRDVPTTIIEGSAP